MKSYNLKRDFARDKTIIRTDDHNTAVRVFAFFITLRKLIVGSIINKTAGFGDNPKVTLFNSSRRARFAAQKVLRNRFRIDD